MYPVVNNCLFLSQDLYEALGRYRITFWFFSVIALYSLPLLNNRVLIKYKFYLI